MKLEVSVLFKWPRVTIIIQVLYALTVKKGLYFIFSTSPLTSWQLPHNHLGVFYPPVKTTDVVKLEFWICQHICSVLTGYKHKLLFFLKYSLCNEPLIELSNPGASGSLFYVSSDDEFIIKTVQHKEAEFLQKLLPGYFMVSQDSVCSV